MEFSDDLVDRLARVIHEDYVRRRLAMGASPGQEPSLASWDLLAETLKESNRDQAKHIPDKLTAISCQVVPADGLDQTLRAFSSYEIEELARIEHERWVRERLAGGWHPASAEDVETKHSPYLVGWEELSEYSRDLDRDTVRAIPRFLGEVGLAVVRRPGPDGSRAGAGG